MESSPRRTAPADGPVIASPPSSAAAATPRPASSSSPTRAPTSSRALDRGLPGPPSRTRDGACDAGGPPPTQVLSKTTQVALVSQPRRGRFGHGPSRSPYRRGRYLVAGVLLVLVLVAA